MSDHFVHPSSYVDGGAHVGAGTRIWHFCHVMTGARIGRDCVLGQNVFVGAGVVMGDNVHVQNNVSLFTGVAVESEVFIGPSVVFTNVATPRSAVPRKRAFQSTIVRRGASIGANATILCGITIGQHALIGAGAVVTRDVPDHGLVYGNPARLRGYACHCGVRLPLATVGAEGQAECGSCGARYIKAIGFVREQPPAGSGAHEP